MRDPLYGVLDRMRKIIHRIDTPAIAGIVMRHMRDSVYDRITHIDIRRSHIDLRTQCFFSVGKAAGLHLLKQRKVFFHAAPPVGVVFSGLRQRTAVFTHFIRR